jgi:single-strand DNA-binding protein
MKGVNKAIILGNVWKDPTIRDTKNGGKVAQVNIVTESGTGEYAKPDWHTIVFYGKQADIVAQYVVKGTNLYVEGRINYRKYTDKSGIEKYVTEVVGGMLTMIGHPDAGKEVTADSPAPRPVPPSIAKEMKEVKKEAYDDVPF